MTQDQASIFQTDSKHRIVEKLPDGSTAVFDAVSETLHSLNPPAAAAFDACKERTTLPQLVRAMGDVLPAPVTEELALVAIAELQQAGLVTAEDASQYDRLATRRGLLKAAGFVLPAVLSLTAAEQRAYAISAGSGTTTAAPTTTLIP
jgi:hypothetical protein